MIRGPLSAHTEASPAVPARLSTYIWTVAAAAALGGLLFGYDWVVIGGARQFYEIYFHLTRAVQVGWANSCALLGCLVGSITAGYCADRYGRRNLLLAAGLLFALSSAMTGWSYTFVSFILWRIGGGVAIGLSSNVSPLYIAEISPASIRGRLVSLNQFAIVIGILAAQIVNWLIARPMPADATAGALFASWDTQFAWRWMFTAVLAPSVVFVIASLFLPESPRWLLARQENDAAQAVLERIGGKPYAESEMARITQTIHAESTRTTAWRDLFQPGVRRIVIVAVLLAVLQQWTGVNTLFNYAAEIYHSAGYGTSDIFLNIVITGSINLIFTILAMFLVDTFGRRKLMLIGCVGIGLSNVLCAIAFRAQWHGVAFLVLTLSAIACYAVTLAPVTWVLISEIFPNRVRSHGVSIAVSSLWIASFLLTYTFPILNRIVGMSGIFMSYGLVCFGGVALVFFGVPETSRRSLEEIESTSVPSPSSQA